MKVIRQSESPNHPLVKALVKAGHSDVEIQINQAGDFMSGRRGVYLYSNKANYELIGYTIASAIKKLNKK